MPLRARAWAALACLALPFWSSGLAAGQYNAVVDIGDLMPRFGSLPATDGGQLSSSDLQADVVVLVSLANHCPWSRGTERDLMRTIEGFERDGLSVQTLGFAVGRDEADRLPAMRRRAKAQGYNFAYVFDQSQRLGRALGAARTPEYFVYDKSRRLVYTGLLHDSPAMERGGTLRYPNGEPSVFTWTTPFAPLRRDAARRSPRRARMGAAYATNHKFSRSASQALAARLWARGALRRAAVLGGVRSRAARAEAAEFRAVGKRAPKLSGLCVGGRYVGDVVRVLPREIP